MNIFDAAILVGVGYLMANHLIAGLIILIILLAIKWLFIEQDITYWNWSGRNMLYNHLIEMGLV